jgi:hypothetical protein
MTLDRLQVTSILCPTEEDTARDKDPRHHHPARPSQEAGVHWESREAERHARSWSAGPDGDVGP